MNLHDWLAVALVACLGVAIAEAHEEHAAAPAAKGPVAQAVAGGGTLDARSYSTDTELLNQDGETVRFYSDVLAGRVVLLNVIFTSCEDACPLITRKLTEVRKALGKDAAQVHFISLTSDPLNDSPQALKAYARKHGADDANWTFLTGPKEQMDVVLGRLGQLSRSPEEHSTLLIAGDVANKRWSKIRPDAPPAAIAQRLQLLTLPPAAGALIRRVATMRVTMRAATLWRGVAWLLWCGLIGWAGMATALQLTPEEAAGKRIYLHGIGSSDAAIQALVGVAGTSLPATSLPCAGCHGSDGRGKAEGGVRPPDITWLRLSAPNGQRPASGRQHPAYDDGAFARALGEGLDPAGNRLNPAMPRFVMSLRDMRNLTAYIKRLDDDSDPGLHDEVLRLGTLLPANGPLAELGDTVSALLQGMLDGINEAGGIHGRRLQLVVVDPGADRASAEAALGELLDRRDVLALVAPLAPALEGDYAALLAASGTPLVGPLLQFADDSSRLVFDPLPGLREQLFALGDFARASPAFGSGATLVAYPQDERYRALAEALAGRLQAQGWQQVQLFAYRPEVAGADLPVLADLQALFFLGPADAFVALARTLAAAGARPYLFAASSQVAGAVLRIPPPFNGRLFLAYPFLPADWTPAGSAALQAVRQRSGLGERHAALQVSAYSAALVLAEGLKRAGRDASREKLLSALENLHGFHTGVTPVLGFGPGRRVGAPGAHIVAVDLEQGLFRPTGRYLKVDSP